MYDVDHKQPLWDKLMPWFYGCLAYVCSVAYFVSQKNNSDVPELVLRMLNSNVFEVWLFKVGCFLSCLCGGAIPSILIFKTYGWTWSPLPYFDHFRFIRLRHFKPMLVPLIVILLTEIVLKS